MRVRTIKRLAILIAVLGLVSGSAVWGWNWQITRMAHSKALEAENAAKKGDFATAERLFQEHMALVPNDVNVEIALADSLANNGGTITRRTDAMRIYENVLRRYLGRDDVRRKLMQLKVKSGLFIVEGGAELDLKLLLKKSENENDGELLFWMGRCAEEARNDAGAAKHYQLATKADTPPTLKIDAYRRLANVLRGNDLKKPDKADQAIEEMVQSDPTNYKVYLERSRYIRQFKLATNEAALEKAKADLDKASEAALEKAKADLKKASAADLAKAVELADREPEVYLEMASAATTGGRQAIGAARQILEDGLKKRQSSAALYFALAQLELQSNGLDQAIKTLERGLEAPAETSETDEHDHKSVGETVEKSNLLSFLATLLANRGDTGKLLLRINELENAGVSPLYLNYLNAYYNVNIRDFRKAKELLVPIDSKAGLSSDFKAKVKDLLARCYSKLGDPNKQADYIRQIVEVNPNDIQARRRLIEMMSKNGDIEGAINEYRSIAKLPRYKPEPQDRLNLSMLLIARNRQRPKPQRDWTEVATAIDDAANALPDTIEPVVLRAEMYVAQEQPAEAQAVLEKARPRFLKNVSFWSAEANLLAAQKQFDAALALLDRAREQLGDKVEFRLQSARIAKAKGGPQVAAKLNDLGQDIDAFSKDDRTKLLYGLAVLLDQVQDSEGAGRLWSRLAEQEPNNL
jgi:cellulose synthase operon protein C